MTKTKALAIFVAVVGTLLFLKNYFYPPTKNWEDYNHAGLSAYNAGNLLEAQNQFLAALKQAEEFSINDPRLNLSLNNLMEVYRAQNKYVEAEIYIKQSLENSEKIYGDKHIIVAANLKNLGENYLSQEKFEEAEPILKRALNIFEKTLGQKDPLTTHTLERYISVLQKMGRNIEGEGYVANEKFGKESLHGEN